MNEIRFPIAKHKHTGELVNIKDAKSGAECDCICYECGEGLVAINKKENKQSDHFRHHPGSKCGANFESYIHWLAKEVICSADTFTIPEIHSKLVLEYSRSEFEEKIKKLFEKHEVPEPFRKSFKYKFVLQESKIIKIDSSTSEATFNTIGGPIRVDVKIESQGNNLLIEPFFKHPIDETKRNKLRDLDETVIDINLQPFGPGMGYSFTLDNFKSNLVNGTGLKTWTYIKRKKIKFLQKILLVKIDEQLSNSKEFFAKFESFNQNIADEEKELKPIKDKIVALEKRLSEVRSNLSEGFERIQDIRNKRLEFANSFLPDDKLKSHPDPWNIRSFED